MPTLSVLKPPADVPVQNRDGVQTATNKLLQEIEQGGEATVLELCKRFDGVQFARAEDVVVSAAALAAAEASLTTQVKRDINKAHVAIRAFAIAQRQSILDLNSDDSGDGSKNGGGGKDAHSSSSSSSASPTVIWNGVEAVSYTHLTLPTIYSV